MTVREMIAQARSEMGEVGRLFYASGTTDGAGAADGSTLVLSTMTQVADALNEGEVKITSGSASGERREVADFASGTITVRQNFSYGIASGVTFEVGEKRFVSDFELIDWFTKCQDELITMLVVDAFPGHSTVLEVGGTLGLSDALPANLAGPPNSMQFRAIDLTEYDVSILPPGEKDRFYQDAFLGSELDDMVAIFENGKIKYRPVNTGTLLLPVVPKFDAVTVSGGSKLPSYMHYLQVTYAAWKGLESRERGEAASKMGAFFKAVDTINARYGNITKQMEKDS